MSFEIFSVLSILIVAIFFFVTEKVRMDVVALAVLSVLAGSRLVSPEVALGGFSNPAVITVWAMFILSAGLSAAGLDDLIGRQILKVSGCSETGLIIAIMLTTGCLSAFMSNIGVAALMLPVVIDLARRTKTSPSRLLMPMAFASLLGGICTLIGTPPNLVASNALAEAGHEPFSLFEFAPIGVPALVVGTLFMALIGRRLLPRQLPARYKEEWERDGFDYAHTLEKQILRLQVKEDSPFVGCTLEQTRLGPLLGFHVDAINRDGKTISNLDGNTVLNQEDILIINGKVEDFEAFRKWQAFELANGAEIAEMLSYKKLVLISALIKEGGNLDGLTVSESDFRNRFEGMLLSIRDEEGVKRTDLAQHVFKGGDRLHIEIKKESLPIISESEHLEGIELIAEESLGDIFPDTDALLELALPPESHLIGLRLRETGLAEDLNLKVIGIARKPESLIFPGGEQKLLAGDKLLVQGNRTSIALIRGLQSLVVENSGDVAAPLFMVDRDHCEVTLPPQSTLSGRSLKEINFRNRFGLQVESIWRSGRSYRSHLRNMSIEFGDALLLSGPRERIDDLEKDRDFLVLTRSSGEQKKNTSVKKAVIASVIMIGVVTSILLGWLPVAIASVIGATLMILMKCVTIEDAYRSIDWKAVFLIACMIPLGTAMKDTGAAAWLGQGVAVAAKPLGPWGLLICLYILTSLATTIIPTAALIVIMASLGIDAAAGFGIDPKWVVLAIAMAASASFISPISHPSNILVMGPGGYRFVDYMKTGLLLVIVVLLTVLPMIWYLSGKG